MTTMASSASDQQIAALPRSESAPYRRQDTPDAMGDACSFISGGGAGKTALADDTESTGTHQEQRDRSATYGSSDDPVKMETDMLRCSKLLFLFVLGLAAVAIFGVVLVIIQQNDQDEFETRFHILAEHVVELSSMNARAVVGSLESVSFTFASYASINSRSNSNNNGASASGEKEDLDATWPLLHIPNFEAHYEQLRRATGTEMLTLTPLVTADTKSAFEDFQNENGDWIEESLRYAQHEQSNLTIIPRVWEIAVDDTSNAPAIMYPQNETMYAPISQLAPIQPFGRSIVNIDTLRDSNLASLFKTVRQRRRPILSNALHTDLTVPISSHNNEADCPFSFVAVPVYATLTPNPAMGAATGDLNMADEPEFVGTVNAKIPWSRYFEHVTSDHVDDVDVAVVIVIQNTCGEDFTFRIGESQLEYVGLGDKHNEDFDDFEVQWDFSVIESVHNCSYSMSIYPATEPQEVYTSKTVVYTALIVVAIFLLMGVFFFMYDRLVQHRQRKVLESAAKSNSIVRALFPANVRGRLLGNSLAQPQEDQVKRTSKSNLDLKDDAERVSPLEDDAIKVPRSRRRRSVKSIGSRASDASTGNLEPFSSGPIADFFPSVTVLFADLAGFTAWSSTRDPVQVFTLLETIYNAFDRIANRLDVFKVETIGDCYVAACGLPEPRDDHAVVLFRFCRLALAKTKDLIEKLSLSLGPDTGSLAIRFGLHSGPVTAGVLRGQKSRFQLFGDTVNTASRIENSGRPNRIHLSQETANELKKHGKAAWFKPRDDAVIAKGKGSLVTYWGIHKADGIGSGSVASSKKKRDSAHNTSHSTAMNQSAHFSDSGSLDSFAGHQMPAVQPKQPQLQMEPHIMSLEALRQLKESQPRVINARLVASKDIAEIKKIASKSKQRKQTTERHIMWSVVTFKQMLRMIIATRDLEGDSLDDSYSSFSVSTSSSVSSASSSSVPLCAEMTEPLSTSIASLKKGTALDELADALTMPTKKVLFYTDPNKIDLPPTVERQIEEFVQTIANCYRFNSFHSFTHASHVIQSVQKLLSRITKPTDEEEDLSMSVESHGENDVDPNDFVYSIRCDPLTRFACIFAALIHDVDHMGVPNTVLVEKNHPMAALYKGRAVAEQNSIDLAWNLLFEPRFNEFRQCLLSTEQELRTFRSLVVQSVIATDIMDKDLKKVRTERWQKAFAPTFAPTFAPCVSPSQASTALETKSSSSADPSTSATPSAVPRSISTTVSALGLPVTTISTVAADKRDASNSSDTARIDSNSDGDHLHLDCHQHHHHHRKNSERQYRNNLKATLVLEHLIQASDIAHTMQHWHIYIKWNEALFDELYKAHQDEKSSKDPSEGWYEGEIGFFDFYVIPLAKKLKDCGVFGVSSDEYLNYAIANRNEWEHKGEDIVKRYLKKYNP